MASGWHLPSDSVNQPSETVIGKRPRAGRCFASETAEVVLFADGSVQEEVRGVDNMGLAGKSALVTGSSRGIGRGCAIEMARAGANVAINYYSHADEAEDVANECRKHGVKAIALQGDVSNRVRVEEMFDESVKAFGKLDL